MRLPTDTPARIVSHCPGRALLILRITGAAATVVDEHGNDGIEFPKGLILMLDIKQGCEAPWDMYEPGGGECDIQVTEIFDG